MTGTCRQSAGGSRARGRRCDRRRRAPRADIHGRPVLDRSRGHGAQRPDEGDPARRGTRPIGRNGTVPGEHGAVSRGLCPPGSSKVSSCLEGPWPLRNAVQAVDMPPPPAAAAEAKADDLREALARAEEAAAGLRSEDELPARVARDCVIVDTSTLEFGIDVGDLDRVIHVNSPPTVTAFLQRMGRTGRRPSTARNCLFLSLSEGALVWTAGLLHLWTSRRHSLRHPS